MFRKTLVIVFAMLLFAMGYTPAVDVAQADGPITTALATTGFGNNTGTLNGVPFTITSTEDIDGIFDDIDLSGDPNYDSHPPTNTLYFSHTAMEDLTITFDSPLDNLYLYTIFYRGFRGSCPGDVCTYTFNASPTIDDGLDGPGITLVGNVLTVPDSPSLFGNGILRFDGPISELSITTNSASFSYIASWFGTVSNPVSNVQGAIDSVSDPDVKEDLQKKLDDAIEELGKNKLHNAIDDLTKLKEEAQKAVDDGLIPQAEADAVCDAVNALLTFINGQLDSVANGLNGTEDLLDDLLASGDVSQAVYDDISGKVLDAQQKLVEGKLDDAYKKMAEAAEEARKAHTDGDITHPVLSQIIASIADAADGVQTDQQRATWDLYLETLTYMPSGELNGTALDKLGKELEDALVKLGEGKDADAIDKLADFQTEAQKAVDDGNIVSQSTADALIASAQAIIDNL